MSGIYDCKALMDMIPAVFPASDEYCQITDRPNKIVQSQQVRVAIWAYLTDDRTSINQHMRLPSLIKFLDGLADDGLRCPGEWHGIRFMFIESR